MIIRKGYSVRMPVRLINASGAGVPGVLPAQISDGTGTGRASVVKADGTVQTVSLVTGDTWFEIGAAKVPGLYHVVVSAAATDVLGTLQLGVFPAASDFLGTVVTGQVELMGDAAEAALGKWQIFATGPDSYRMVLYKEDGVTVLKRFELRDAVGDLTYTNPFSRTPV